MFKVATCCSQAFFCVDVSNSYTYFCLDRRGAYYNITLGNQMGFTREGKLIELLLSLLGSFPVDIFSGGEKGGEWKL